MSNSVLILLNSSSSLILKLTNCLNLKSKSLFCSLFVISLVKLVIYSFIAFNFISGIC